MFVFGDEPLGLTRVCRSRNLAIIAAGGNLEWRVLDVVYHIKDFVVGQFAENAVFLILTGFAVSLMISNYRLRAAERALQTERDRLEERVSDRTRDVSRSETFLRTVADNLPVSIAYIDSENKFRFENKTSRTWHSESVASLGGDGHSDDRGDVMLPAARERFDSDRIYAELALKGEATQTERVLRLTDGRQRTVSVSRLPDIDEHGSVRGYFRLGIDISEQKASEALLNRRNNFIRSVTDNLPISIAYIDAAGRIQFVNRTTEMWNSALRMEMIGRKFDEFVALAPGDLDAVNRTLAGQTSVSERQIVYPDGVTRWVEITRIPDFDEDNNLLGYFRMAIDITERKNIEAAKEEFISTMNHELRTPLTSIKGSLALIKSGAVGAIPDGVAKLVDIASGNSERLIALINDILDAQKIAAGRMEYVFTPLELVAFLAEAIEATRGFGDTYKVRFVLRTALAAAWIDADHGRLMQVMSNLLSNAGKFSPENDEIEISLERQDRFFRISVHDNGPGIPPEFRAKIFGKFAQADVRTNRRKGGTGLGLNITRSIVEGHGGTIGFECAEGGGTTFYVCLPATAEPERKSHA